MHALIVDDSQDVREILGVILNGFGIDVYMAENTQDAFDILKKHTNDIRIALVDLYMPDMNGLDFVKAMRSMHDYDQIRIMMVTTETQYPLVKKALDSGANEYLMKPFCKEMIEEKLKILEIL